MVYAPVAMVDEALPLARAQRAIDSGMPADLRELVTQFREILSALDENRRSLVNYACRTLTRDISRPPERGTPDQHACLSVLLGAGADVSAADEDGFAPLHVAAIASYPELAAQLLAAGAPQTGRVYDCDGGTPLALALFYGERDVARLLADDPLPDNLRTAAALGRDLDRFFSGDELTMQAADGCEFTYGWCGKAFAPRENSRQEIVDEALCWAARCEQIASLDALLARGGNVNTTTFRGTPLTWAVGYNAIRGARWLLDHGAEPNLRHDFGGAGHGKNAVALHLAAQYGALDCIRLLLERGADPHVRDAQWNCTPLEWAEHVGAVDSARLLKQLT